MQSKNIILYGPPGTGKTYISSQLAVAIVEHLTEAEIQTTYTRRELQKKFRQYQQEGRIAFVTFHQSFSYEDFVEGIKPFKNDKNELYYDVEDGVFKQICYNAAYTLFLSQQRRIIQKAGTPGKSNFDNLYFEFLDYLKRMMKSGSKEIIFETRTQKPVYLENINKNDTLEFRYEKGSRTYGITKSVMAKIYRKFQDVEQISQRDADFQQVAGKGNSTLAWAVFNRLKEFEKTRLTTYNYIINHRQFKGQQVTEEQYQRMKRDLAHLDYQSLSRSDYQKAGNFVLVIDEINRGNIAGILGELITLLEEDKRAGMTEALHTVLPYSREHFTIPPNLYIIGTMNSADRSIEALDAALRRRFSFQELLPQPDLLGTAAKADEEQPTAMLAAESLVDYQASPIQKIEDMALDQLLTVINLRLEKLIDRDHSIGHGYFLPVLRSANPLQKLKEIFYQQIIPLLQEYFFSDFAKIELIIGKGFFEKEQHQGETARNFFAETDQDLSFQEEYFLKPVYRIKFLDDQEFKKAVIQIYERKNLP